VLLLSAGVSAYIVSMFLPDPISQVNHSKNLHIHGALSISLHGLAKVINLIIASKDDSNFTCNICGATMKTITEWHDHEVETHWKQ
jgi:hypothetical protein